MRRVLLGVAVLCGAGCGGDSYTVVPVSGKVTLDGQPLADADVTFQPKATTNLNPGPGSYGKTNARGEYTLTVVGQSRGGAVVGTHSVSISAAAGPRPDPSDDRPHTVKNKVPEKYNDPVTGLTCDVPRGGTSKADFELKSR